jgi:hypothetical protein
LSGREPVVSRREGFDLFGALSSILNEYGRVANERQYAQAWISFPHSGQSMEKP